MRGEPSRPAGALTQTTTDDIATAVPSLVWFDRWTIVLLVTAGVDILLALGLQFRILAFNGPTEAMMFISIPVMLVTVIGWSYTGIRFWAQIRRGEHLTRADRRRRVWAYALALSVAAFVGVAAVFGAHNKLWLWAYVPAGVLLALAPTLRPRKRVRTRRSRATEPHTDRPQR